MWLNVGTREETAVVQVQMVVAWAGRVRMDSVKEFDGHLGGRQLSWIRLPHRSAGGHAL